MASFTAPDDWRGCSMSLKACRECGLEVSTEATTCPHCGVKSPTAMGGIRFDRVAIFLIIIVVIGYLLQGSEKENGNKTSPAASTSSSNQTASSDRKYPLSGETGTMTDDFLGCSSK